MEFKKNQHNNWRIKLSIAIILFHVLFYASFSQNTNQKFDILSTQLDSISKNEAPELIYLQTNKNIYETGEDLWFKAYLLDAQYLTLSVLSQTLHLQLLNANTKLPVWQEKYEIRNGFANGHVYLNDTLSEDNYLLVAFTENSFFENQPDFKTIRKIVVKKDLKPRITVSANFTKASFGRGDSVALTILTLDEKRKPQYAQITASLLNDGKELEVQQTQTQADGEVLVRYKPTHTNEGLSVKVVATHSKATENISLSVPFHKGSPIQFGMFPEGGNLIHGQKSKVAFKAINYDGLPENVGGVLLENSDTILKFESSHYGMGSFSFIPDANKNYKVRLTQTDSIFNLPLILPAGISMSLAKRDSSYLWFKVRQSPVMPQTEIYLRGQSRGVVYCMASGKLKNELDIKIPLNQFPLQGIAEFTLFNKELKPVAERLVYVNPENKLNIDVKLNKKKYSTREKVSINLRVTDQKGQPVQANLGATVFDKIYRNNDKKNILTHCHLFSQLKGDVYNPGYYFDENNKNYFNDLDLLLLTQGWRKYVWSNKVLEEQKTEQPIILDGIKGEIHAAQKRKQAQGMPKFVMAHNPGKEEKNNLIMANLDGSFMITPSHLKMYQTGYVYLKPMSSKYKSLINIAEPFNKINNVLTAKNIIYPITSFEDTKEDNTRPYIVGPDIIELGEVVIKRKGKQVFRDKYMGQLDSMAKLDLNDDFVATCGTLNCFIHGRKNSTEPVEGELYEVHLGKDGRILDETYKERTYYGTITIKYKLPQFTEEELLKMYNLYRIKAYYGEREFYQPNYDKKEEQNNMIPDYRNTLLWEPAVITNKNGEATLEFFCSDIYTGFTGIIEGVNESGQLGYKEFEFTVRKTKRFEWEK